MTGRRQRRKNAAAASARKIVNLLDKPHKLAYTNNDKSGGGVRPW